ncbi:hypothetical protein ACFQH6_14455 [Halobacteriaceae archaeon GCM10025711]
MHRSHVAALLVLATVVLAGCTGLPGGGAPYETPLNGTEMDARHTAALQDAGSYTYDSTTNTTLFDQSTNVNATVKMDREANTTLVTADSAFGEMAVYVPPDGPGYQRLGTGSDARYERLDERPNVSRFTGTDFANLTTRYEFAQNGTTTLDGETVWVYEANETNVTETAFADEINRSTNVSIRLYAREDGLVTRTDAHLTVDTPIGTQSFAIVRTYTAVGETTVEEPSWVADAKERTAA